MNKHYQITLTTNDAQIELVIKAIGDRQSPEQKVDFRKLLKAYLSCENIEQLTSCYRMIDLYENKWKNGELSFNYLLPYVFRLRSTSIKPARDV